MSIENLCMGCMEKEGSLLICPHCGWIKGNQPESPLHLSPGTILLDKYLLGRVLGQGGFGITYLAWDIYLERKLAVKEFFPRDFCYRESGYSKVSIYSGTTHDQYEYGLDKFLAEGKTLARFDGHPNIVSVKDFFKANETAYLVMNYLDGTTLCNYLTANNETLAFEETIQIIIPVLDALRAVHEENLLHRDISPDNIMISQKGRIIILDFGAARHAIGEKGKHFSVVIKPGYAPEEQYRSNGLQGPWTDIYATAATMYHALTGYMPPESLDRLNKDNLIRPSELGIHIPRQEEEALLTAMAIKSEHRYQQVEDFQKALLGPSAIHEPLQEPGHTPVKDNESFNKTGDHAAKYEDNSQYDLQVKAVTINIGRASDNDLVLEENTISRYHARLQHENNTWYLSDLNSSHGTYLNGTPVHKTVEIPSDSWITISTKLIHFDGKGLYSKDGQSLLEIYYHQPVLNAGETMNSEIKVVTQADSAKKNQIPALLTVGSLLAITIVASLVYFMLNLDIFSTDTSSPDHAQITFTDSSDEIPVEPYEESTGVGKQGDQADSVITIEFSNGTYTGEVKNGVPDGYGVFIYKRTDSAMGGLQSGSSRRYEGYWKDGKMHGEGTFTYPDGHTKRGIWVNGVFTKN